MPALTANPLPEVVESPPLSRERMQDIVRVVFKGQPKALGAAESEFAAADEHNNLGHIRALYSNRWSEDFSLLIHALVRGMCWRTAAHPEWPQWLSAVLRAPSAS
jgi:hypothetical protein